MSEILPPAQTVVFFDGVCGLCSRFVDTLIRWDARRKLRYAALQGETARNILFQGMTPTRLGSLVVFRHGQLFYKSEAVLVCLAELGGGFRFLPWLRWIPRFLRDGIYDLIAINRYQLFGRLESCRLPTREESDLFLP